ncbi:hypothetical protein V1512DRAFT_247942 [Lipomyces arxii]|uniref:uncharacterized protein n=1 Tax=Lipomyces arxii TaxID=56418 RepID=UPI0034CDC0FA
MTDRSSLDYDELQNFELHYLQASEDADLNESQETNLGLEEDLDYTRPVNSKICPDCKQSSLRRCLIQKKFAIVICIDKKCAYPFGNDDILKNILYVKEEEVLHNCRQHLLRAGVGVDTAHRIAPINTGMASGR